MRLEPDPGEGCDGSRNRALGVGWPNPVQGSDAAWKDTERRE